MKFVIAIEPGTDREAYGVVVPDLPGCFSAGDTVDEAFDNAREAIEAHVEVLAEEGKEIPEPKSLSEWQKDQEYRGWTWGIIEVPVEKLFGPAEKINITVPSLLLKRIDSFAVEKGDTRSGFLTKAAVTVMGTVHSSGKVTIVGVRKQPAAKVIRTPAPLANRPSAKGVRAKKGLNA